MCIRHANAQQRRMVSRPPRDHEPSLPFFARQSSIKHTLTILENVQVALYNPVAFKQADVCAIQ
ncbi:hypothetical protein OVY01_03290 [Robbsia sp. Bb-Pol-6]|uniref:Uncharacterized protein n=1 Tax=Robbsia betulipollinis TaxID=2981849 RepID=A0ABT3ZK02_9BURK|nr:hypothetical protein [Robbsia betulipollinis]